MFSNIITSHATFNDESAPTEMYVPGMLLLMVTGMCTMGIVNSGNLSAASESSFNEIIPYVFNYFKISKAMFILYKLDKSQKQYLLRKITIIKNKSMEFKNLPQILQQ